MLAEPGPNGVPTAPIPFGNILETTSEEISGASPEAYNIIADARGTLRKRPGLAAYSVAPSSAVDAAGVLALYLTEERLAHTSGTAVVSGVHPGVLYAVGATVNASGGGHNRGRNLYRVAGGTATLLAGTANEDRLSTPTGIATTRFPRPTLVETEALLVLAGGAEMAKVDVRPETFSAPNFTTNASYHAVAFLAGCPPLAGHILTNSSRILANDTQLDQTKVRYSNITQGIVDTTGHETWDPSPGAAGFFTAEAKSDSIVAIAENTNDIFVFGRRNLQLFAPDGSTTFAPTTTKEVGCLAPHSPVKFDDQYVWLDHLTRVIESDGRQWKDIGAPIQQTLDELLAPDDCYGYRFSETFADCIVLRFEAAGETLTYQPNVGWCRWALFDEASEEWVLFPVLSHHLRSDGGLNIVGLDDGTIRTLSLGNTTDLGEPIVAFVSTGFLDRDTDARKHTRAVHLTFKREESTQSQVCYLDYRDSLTDDWTELAIDLGTEDGDLTPVVTFRSLGVYYRRQWRFRFPDEGGLRLVKVTEDFIVDEG